MHAFIIRPFGIKKGIDFELVEAQLIGPALKAAGFSGGTTGEFIQQGNIRTDMFEQLLIADFVIADLSIHNANAFYELGIRHAFRDKRTFLIRSKGDDVPFDLKTDRYLSYDAADPAACLPLLIKALKESWDSQKQDSPVFQLLPGLKATDPEKFIVVPAEFREQAENAESDQSCGTLRLLYAEMDGLAWRSMGLRLIGNAQCRLQDWHGAMPTWDAVRAYNAADVEANTCLGTIYQRLGDLTRSDQALQRALKNNDLRSWDMAEIWALLGRNAKTLWERDWCNNENPEAIQAAAITSPYLQKSFDLYHSGFIADRNHYYSGLNALAMLSLMVELAAAQPALWEEDFDSNDEADLKLAQLKKLGVDLAAGVRLSILSRRTALARENATDVWVEISDADLSLLSSDKPARVGRAYAKAIAGAPANAVDAARKQLLLYRRLRVFTANSESALESLPAFEESQTAVEKVPHVLLFTGHRIDALTREKPRFPAAKETQARKMLMDAISAEKDKVAGELLGLTGGASGGDILFHEVCRELEIPTRLYLALPQDDYIQASVADAGAQWVERFRRLSEAVPTRILSNSADLPRWLQAKPSYGIWARSNLWMLHSALAISRNNITVIALWDGESGDGPGGTQDMVQQAQARGATFIHLDTHKLLG